MTTLPPVKPILAGERILLVDSKDRHYLVTMVPGTSFHTHAGIVAHDDIIGFDEGRMIKGSTDRSFLILRPTLADVVVKMPRGAQDLPERLRGYFDRCRYWTRHAGSRSRCGFRSAFDDLGARRSFGDWL